MEQKVITINSITINTKHDLAQFSLALVDETYREHANRSAGRSANKEKAVNRLWKFLDPSNAAKKSAVKAVKKPLVKTVNKPAVKLVRVTKADLKPLNTCAKVHAICDANPDAARKDIISLCEAQDINKSTASTQYQKWKKAKESIL